MTAPKPPAPTPSLPPAAALAPAKNASPTRSLSAARSRRCWGAARGNQNSMRHGIMAVVANAPDTATEVALTYATHPGLEDLADLRLVETYALAAVQYRRAIAAIDAQGMTPVLTAYSSRLAALVERLERAVHEREKERIAQMRRGKVIDLSMYARDSTP